MKSRRRSPSSSAQSSSSWESPERCRKPRERKRRRSISSERRDIRSSESERENRHTRHHKRVRCSLSGDERYSKNFRSRHRTYRSPRHSRSRSRDFRSRSRSYSYSSSHERNYRRRRTRHRESGDESDEKNGNIDHKSGATSSRNETVKEDAKWAKRREERTRLGMKGYRDIWARSPLMHEIHEIYEEYQLLEDVTRSSNDGEVGQKEEKKSEKKKSKKDKKKKKNKDKVKNAKEESEDEWVEVTAEMREAEAAREKLEESQFIGPPIPEHLIQKDLSQADSVKRINYGKDMLRGEGAAMAAYVAQGKRIPRRGEIGLSSSEISDFEKIGYVMSGTRHKSMEATRLRKENQVMTAEEKRLLSGFTHDERKKKEDIVLDQLKSFIKSKKGKSS